MLSSETCQGQDLSVRASVRHARNSQRAVFWKHTALDDWPKLFSTEAQSSNDVHCG